MLKEKKKKVNYIYKQTKKLGLKFNKKASVLTVHSLNRALVRPLFKRSLYSDKHYVISKLHNSTERNQTFFSFFVDKQEPLSIPPTIANDVNGLKNGYMIQLRLQGVGFRCERRRNFYEFYLGRTHLWRYYPRPTVNFRIKKQKILIIGFNRADVKQTAFEIAKFRKPDPYRGKGVQLIGKKYKLKVGKVR